MVGIEKLLVSINLGGKETSVGELVAVNREIHFKYHIDFIDSGIELSPIKMALSNRVLTAAATPFDGLFGVFNDALPDGWGRLLLDRKLTSKGISLGQVTQLDRLAYVGDQGMGALTYSPEYESTFDSEKALELDALAEEMSHILDGTPTDVIEELFDLGGSSGGARPKILVGYNAETNYLIHGAKVLPAGYEHWIIKYPSASDPKDIANIEYAYYKMGLASGIEMSECKLFYGEKNRSYFGTKRFDRVGNKRIHMHSASGIMHDNFRVSSMDYGNLMDCAFRLENDVHAYEKVLRLAAFNVFTHNRDDHSNNFSFLMEADGAWRFSPAYDLTFSMSSHGEHSTSVDGEGKNPQKKHLMSLASIFSMNRPNEVIEEVQEALGAWKQFAKASGVTRDRTQVIQ